MGTEALSPSVPRHPVARRRVEGGDDGQKDPEAERPGGEEDWRQESEGAVAEVERGGTRAGRRPLTGIARPADPKVEAQHLAPAELNVTRRVGWRREREPGQGA